jgi:hypothetical protein
VTAGLQRWVALKILSFFERVFGELLDQKLIITCFKLNHRLEPVARKPVGFPAFPGTVAQASALGGPDEQWTGEANMVGSLNEFLPEPISS